MTSARGVQGALLDRDGTIVLDTDYLRDPDTVQLLPGAAAAIRRLSAAGIPSVVCTNQSGIARGIISLAQYRAVRQRIDDLLRAEGAVLLDSFACPHHPDITGPCDCRKPGTAMYERAAALYGWDLSDCVFIGDKSRDVEPARRFDARAWLVQSSVTPAQDLARAREEGANVAASLAEAVEQLLNPPRVRVAVLASGGGTNLQALLDYLAALGDERALDLVLVASDRQDAGALERARRAGIPVSTIETARHPDAPPLAMLLREHRIELVVLAGYLKLVPPDAIRAVHGMMLNVHPGPLPRFGGSGMYGRHVHQAVLDAGAATSGPTVHLVDEVYDRGPVLAHWPVPLLPNDDAPTLAARVLRAEHLLFPRLVQRHADRLRWNRGRGAASGAMLTLAPFDPALDDAANGRRLDDALSSPT
ncbi:MAG: phosphoribosylglycinamide formyltransferase [Gemmatimonadetes bacterium]|nr:phosphoribosylglycinamide formyltransferase [Gemmatimonadota bacterium]